MKYAIIENNTVINVAIADAPLAANWIQSETAAIGDAYENGDFIKPVVPPPPIPTSVTPRQARLALLGAGLLPLVQTALEALDEPMKSAALIEWEYATTIDRGSNLVTALGGSLGLTEAQLDGLFITAATL